MRPLGTPPLALRHLCEESGCRKLTNQHSFAGKDAEHLLSMPANADCRRRPNPCSHVLYSTVGTVFYCTISFGAFEMVMITIRLGSFCTDVIQPLGTGQPATKPSRIQTAYDRTTYDQTTHDQTTHDQTTHDQTTHDQTTSDQTTCSESCQ
jgi:hypothetical protein